LDVGDDARAARFSFSFGGDGQANLVAVVAEIGTGGGLLFQLFNQGRQVFFEGAVLFGQDLELPLKEGGSQYTIVHRAGLWPTSDWLCRPYAG